MKASTTRVLGIAPLLLYTLGVLLEHAGSLSPAEALGFVLAALPIAGAVVEARNDLVYLPAGALLVLLVFGSLGNGGRFDSGAELAAAGLLLGAPIWMLSLVIDRASSTAWSTLNVPASVGLSVVLLAVVRTLPTHRAGGPGPSWWWPALVSLVWGQGTELRAGLPGAHLPTLPLADLSDPILVVLSVLALLSVLLTLLRPEDRAALGARARSPPPEPLGPEERPGIRGLSGRAIEARVTLADARPPATPEQTGILSLSVALLAVLAFEGAAAASPEGSLLVLVVAVGITSVVLAWIARRSSARAPATAPAPVPHP